MDKREDSGTHGPTWGDVHDYVKNLEGRFKVHITFNVRFLETGKPARRGATCVAQAAVSASYGAEVRARGWHDFRGNAGAATMPTAMWFSLVMLEGKLEGIETVAQARLPF